MRILTGEYFRLGTEADRYDFPFHEVDPRASAVDEDLLRERLMSSAVCNTYDDAMRRLVSKLPTDGMTRFPSEADVSAEREHRAEERLRKVSQRVLPDDLAQMVADPRMFDLCVMSPEVREYCDRRRDEAIAGKDAIYGRWLWHVLEDVPALGEDAAELAMRLRDSFRASREGGDLVLESHGWRLTFHGASSDIGDAFEAWYSEIYREYGVWFILTVDRDQIEHEIRASSFSIEDMRHKR